MAGSWPAGNSTSTTGPVIWITRPVAPAVAVGVAGAIVWGASSAIGSAILGAGRDLDHLAGDVRLANLVVFERVVVDEVFGIVRRIAHRDHARRLLRGLGLEPGLEQARGRVSW